MMGGSLSGGRIGKRRQDARARIEELELALIDIAARARFEQDAPIGLHMTALALIEKVARAALGKK